MAYPHQPLYYFAIIRDGANHTVQYCVLGIMEAWAFLAKLSPKNQTILVPWQYWLGIIKPKIAFSTTIKLMLSIDTCTYILEFLLTDQLPDAFRQA